MQSSERVFRERVISCMRLAESLAAKHRSKYHDARNEAYLALVIAARRYDPKREARFSTYAYRAISNRLANLRRARIPAQVDWNAIQAIEPTESKHSASDFYRLLRAIADNGFDLTVEDRDTVRRVMAALDTHQDRGLVLLLVKGSTQTDIARLLKVSQATVSRQIAAIANNKNVQGVFSDRISVRN